MAWLDLDQVIFDPKIDALATILAGNMVLHWFQLGDDQINSEGPSPALPEDTPHTLRTASLVKPSPSMLLRNDGHTPLPLPLLTPFPRRTPSIHVPPLRTLTELSGCNDSLSVCVSVSLYIYVVTYHLFLSIILIHAPVTSSPGIIKLLMSAPVMNGSVPSRVPHLCQAGRAP